MPRCLFVTDLHGCPDRYASLFEILRREPVDAVFLGGDLLPSAMLLATRLSFRHRDFLGDFLAPKLRSLRGELGPRAPRIFTILGNDDGRAEEAMVLDLAWEGLWTYAHGARHRLGSHPVYGYSMVPPSPFLLKDWERYDVSRYVDPGCVSPEEGRRSVPAAPAVVRYGTIAADLAHITRSDDLSQAILLFHGPPYRTCLDRAALDGKSVDHVPLDVHVGSIAVRRFIEARQPLLTLHGHIHESARLTGAWREQLGRTWILGAAHDGPELCVVRFDTEALEDATRTLI